MRGRCGPAEFQASRIFRRQHPGWAANLGLGLGSVWLHGCGSAGELLGVPEISGWEAGEREEDP